MAGSPLTATLTVSTNTGTKTVTIGGWEITYSSLAGDTTSTVAGVIAALINSHEELNKYIKAVWNNDATVTLTSKIGVLTFDNDLENTHLTKIDPPADAFGLSNSSGSLLAGTYLYCYTYVTQEGETTPSPITSVTITDNKKLTTDEITLPARVDSIRHYISTEANGVRLKQSRKTMGLRLILISYL